MFDKTYVNNSYSGSSKVEVVEKKAPTDESIRLLNEMQNKAFENIIECFKISNNELSDLTCWVYPDYNTWNEKARIRFKLNGRNIDFTFNLPSKYVDSSSIISEILDKVIEEVSKHITSEFIKTNIKQLKDLYRL